MNIKGERTGKEEKQTRGAKDEEEEVEVKGEVKDKVEEEEEER